MVFANHARRWCISVPDDNAIFSAQPASRGCHTAEFKSAGSRLFAEEQSICFRVRTMAMAVGGQKQSSDEMMVVGMRCGCCAVRRGMWG